jgi:hypothetical protein
MKCNNCGEEWKGKSAVSSSLTNCPFCQASLIKEEAKPKFYDNRKAALVAIVQDHGAERLLGKLNSILSDIARIPKDDKELAYAVFEKGASQVLKENLEGTQQDKERAVKIAIDKLPTWIAREAAELIIGEFAEALGWQIVNEKLSRSFGVALFNNGEYVIENLMYVGDNSPSEARQIYGTMVDNQSEIEIKLFENVSLEQYVMPCINENDMEQYTDPALKVKFVGILRLELPSGTPKGSPIEIVFCCDTKGLNIRAKNTATNQVIKSTINYDAVRVLPPPPPTDKVGDIIQFSGYDWRVLEVDTLNKRKLVLSEKVLEERAYNVKYTDVTWETCDLRKYLNGEFLNRLDGKRIVPINNLNSNNPWYDTTGGNNTIDSVFLLSLDEVIKYFGDSGDLMNRKGWYWEDRKFVLKDGQGWAINDQYNDSRIAYDVNDVAKACWWWLRSPGSSSDGAANVYGGGSVDVIGINVHSYDFDYGGVRPALWLNL